MGAKGKIGKMVGTFVVTQAMNIAKDPEVRRAVSETVRPVAGEAGKVAKNAVSKVKLPGRTDPFDAIEDALTTLDAQIDERTGIADAEQVLAWRRQVTSLRQALPLARVAEGKERRRMAKDLHSRQAALLHEVYESTVQG